MTRLAFPLTAIAIVLCFAGASLAQQTDEVPAIQPPQKTEKDTKSANRASERAKTRAEKRAEKREQRRTERREGRGMGMARSERRAERRANRRARQAECRLRARTANLRGPARRDFLRQCLSRRR